MKEHIKFLIGKVLYKLGYLAEFSVWYYPKYRVYFGSTMWQFKKRRKIEKEMKEKYPILKGRKNETK